MGKEARINAKNRMERDAAHEDIEVAMTRRAVFNHLKENGISLSDKHFDKLWGEYRNKDSHPVWTMGFFVRFVNFVYRKQQET